MSLYKRKDSAMWWLNVEWKGFDRIHQSTGAMRKAQAEKIFNCLKYLKAAGRRDLLGLIASRRLSLADVYAAYLRDPDSLDHLRVSEPSPPLGQLVDEWLDWLQAPATASPRTKRPYASETVRRYATSWEVIFERLQRGRDTSLADLTSGAVAQYRKDRIGVKCTSTTVNRDLCAIQSFLRWCADERGLSIDVPKMVKFKETVGRERWLSSAEIEAARLAASPEWWALFATLMYTGIRIGEAQQLRWGDISLVDRKIAIHSGFGRLKTHASDRDVPIPAVLAEILAEHATRFASEPNDVVFPGNLEDYDKAREAWRRICEQSKIAGCRIHDLRHTYGVHATRGGVPLARLQRLLGHTTPSMTMRYMRHAPDADFAADAAAIAESMGTDKQREGQARATLTRPKLVS
jgi:integrase